MKLISITSDAEAGGSSISLINLLKGLKELGWAIHVIVPKKGYLSNTLEQSGIKVSYNPFILNEIWPPINSPMDYLLFIPRLIKLLTFKYTSYLINKKIIIDYNPDIIHTNVSLVSSGYKISNQLKCNHIWHVREYIDKDFNQKVFPSKDALKSKLKKSWCIAITNGIKEYYNLENKCEVIYNGICCKINCTKDVKSSERNFLYVGTINANKGIIDLIEAYNEYINNGGTIPLNIIGPITVGFEHEFQRIIDKINKKELLKYLGYKNDIKHYMQKATALIVPSKYEAFGRITAEAMFNKCLVIGRDTGGTKEQFDFGKKYTGQEIALRFKDTQELVNMLWKVDNNMQNNLNMMIQKAYEFVTDNFTIERNVFLTSRYFQKVFNNDK